jgi:hypothetical protein
MLAAVTLAELAAVEPGGSNNSQNKNSSKKCIDIINGLWYYK